MLRIFTVIPAGSYHFRTFGSKERSGEEVKEDRKEGKVVLKGRGTVFT